MGLYGERVGALHFVCASADERRRVESQMRRIVRPLWSNPPLHGARVAELVLTRPTLRSVWLDELATMVQRLQSMRRRLVDELERAGSTLDWQHVCEQRGMMAFTGLDREQTRRLTEEYAVYLTEDGRIAVTGLQSGNVEYVADAIHRVTL